MNTYEWNCRIVDAYPTHTDVNGVTESQVVYNVHWRILGSDENGNKTTIIGTQTLDTEDLSGFTAFESVTHEQMIAWTKAAMGEEAVAEKESNIDAMLVELATPKTVTLCIEDTPAE